MNNNYKGVSISNICASGGSSISINGRTYTNLSGGSLCVINGQVLIDGKPYDDANCSQMDKDLQLAKKIELHVYTDAKQMPQSKLEAKTTTVVTASRLEIRSTQSESKPELQTRIQRKSACLQFRNRKRQFGSRARKRRVGAHQQRDRDGRWKRGRRRRILQRFDRGQWGRVRQRQYVERGHSCKIRSCQMQNQ